MSEPTSVPGSEGLAHVRLAVRRDLNISPQMYEGRTCYVVKDPVSLQYWRYGEEEHFILQLMNGATTLKDIQSRFEERFRPRRLTLAYLASFAQALCKSGLALPDSHGMGELLSQRHRQRGRRRWLAQLANLLYIRVPLVDPDRLLARMLRPLQGIFTTWFLSLSVLFVLSAVLLVACHFDTFRAGLPAYQEFFSFGNLLSLWIAFACVKVIHELGHGLTCKAFGGEVHEIGVLLLCFSPCLYCNVSDAWTLPSKWKRMLIGFAGIYVELMIAAAATFVWWNAVSHPSMQNLAVNLMVVCGVSTVVFNANPLMRFDGYYILCDWIEIPNLREKANRCLLRGVQETCLGMEMTPEPYRARWRQVVFVLYALCSYVYMWIVSFSILWFFYTFLQSYQLEIVATFLSVFLLASMVGWPVYRLGKSVMERGRLPDVQPVRALVSLGVLACLVLSFFLVPLPVARVRQTGLVQIDADALDAIYLRVPGVLLELHVRDGQWVPEGFLLAEFRNAEMEDELESARTELGIQEAEMQACAAKMRATKDEVERRRTEAGKARARGERDRLAAKVNEYATMMEQLRLRAPRAGVVLRPPRKDDVGKRWDQGQTTPFCTIGNPDRLRVLAPVSTAAYHLLTEDREASLRQGGDLAVDIRVQGLGGANWQGKIVHMTESDAKDIPLALTTRGGGPIPIKPASQTRAPQSQHYLVIVEIAEPDPAICPGALAQVKIHCRWRTAASMLWRTMCALFA